MHTSAFTSCRIHYNSGYDGEIIITNMDSSSVPIGKKAEIETTALKILSEMKNRSGDIIVLTEVQGDEITVLTKDIESFVTEIIKFEIDRMIEEMDYEGIMKLYKIMTGGENGRKLIG